MSWWDRFLIKSELITEENLPEYTGEGDLPEPKVNYEEIPGTLDIGWYYSENDNEIQMAKINEADRATHFYVVGATGTGKTRFLEFLIQQDIAKGNGFGVIDPHGDLTEDIKGFLARYAETTEDESLLTDRTILIDPTAPHSTVTFNPLEAIKGVTVPQQTRELVNAFKRIWEDSWGVRMEDLMRNALIALGEAELTLAHLPRFLIDKTFRDSVLERVSHQIVLQYFQQRYDRLSKHDQAVWIEPVMNKVNAFLSDERIFQLFSHKKSSFNLRDIMDNRKILLMKLDKGKLADISDLLGSLLMAKIQMAGFSRSDIPESQRVPFYLYIDEFQNFASESFSLVLSESRKYGISLIMAHQDLAQIPQDLRSSVLGNTGIQVSFRLNRKDAEMLAKEAFEYSGHQVKSSTIQGTQTWSLGEEWEQYTGEIQGLPPRCCYVKHKIAGGVIGIQTVEIEPPWELLGIEEGECQDYLNNLPFGEKYLVPRSELLSVSRDLGDQEDQGLLEDESIQTQEDKPVKPTVKTKEVPKKPARKQAEYTPKTRPAVELPTLEGVGGQQHRYLQTLIKKMAEDKGFRAVIEQATPDGKGKVDVGLELQGKRIACEVSMTTNEEQELGNIRKCLTAGYDKVVVCSSDKKAINKMQSLIKQELNQVEQEKVLVLQPEQIFLYLDNESAKVAGKENRIKGRRVKVQYSTIDEAEQQSKREAVGQVIFQSMKRLESKKPKK